MIKLAQNEFLLLSGYIKSLTGISLDSSKNYLIENRFQRILAERGFSSFSELYFKLKSGTDRHLVNTVIDAITTGETSFFRDAACFDLLQYKVLPDLIDKRSRTGMSPYTASIRILSAACSTGQEVYSIAMMLKEMLGDSSRYNMRILGVDISNAAIAAASRGCFGNIEIDRGLSKERLDKHFMREGDKWRISDPIRSMASFKTANILTDISQLGKFDIILCRYLSIYFHGDEKKTLFDNLSMVLENDGYMIIGATESLFGITDRFESKRYLKSIFYQFRQ